MASAIRALPTTASSAITVLPGPAGLAGGSALHDASTNAAIVQKAVAAGLNLFLGMARTDAPDGGPMATATSKQPAKAVPGNWRTAKLAALTLLVLAMLWLVWNWNSIKGEARIGAAYGAHIACSCRYIAGRDMASCETDKEAGMGMVRLSDDPENKRVYASVPFLAEAVAERRGTFGCVQLNEAEIEAL
jgi:hypothetical protein